MRRLSIGKSHHYYYCSVGCMCHVKAVSFTPKALYDRNAFHSNYFAHASTFRRGDFVFGGGIAVFIGSISLLIRMPLLPYFHTAAQLLRPLLVCLITGCFSWFIVLMVATSGRCSSVRNPYRRPGFFWSISSVDESY